jgi:hypothetical protein
MNKKEFLEKLISQKFPTPTLVDREANGALDDHCHPFEVMALVISGTIDIVIKGKKTTYTEGDIFHLTHSQTHAEAYGNQGVQYLASRKESI